MLGYLTDKHRFRYRNVVFLLGAGASYDHGYPLVGEFLSPKYLRWLCDQCAGLGAGAGAMLPEGSDELSYALSEAEAFKQLSDHFEEVLSKSFDGPPPAYDRVLAYTNWVLASAWSMVHSSELMSTAEYMGLAIMLLDLNQTGNSCVITFNYDTSAEDAISSCSSALADGSSEESLFFNYGFEDRIWDLWPKHHLNFSTTILPHTYPDSGVLVLKLHGSVNLLACRQCSALHYSSLEALSHRFMFQSRDLLDEVHACKVCGGRPLNLLLVPPGKRKRPGEVLKQLWRTAAERLSAADLVVLGGYSVPAYDEEARLLLQTNLKGKDVLLVDPFPGQQTIDFLRTEARSTLRVLRQGFSEFLRYEINTYNPNFLDKVEEHCRPLYLYPERLQGHPRA
jgi:NAD-dependent SIR2 family protein deacetylase